jgi:anti-sigma factor RsiW
MSNNHQIFRDRIQAWLSNELAVEILPEVEAHLAACPECSALAAAEKELWEMLAHGDVRTSGPGKSVWPEVRQRTVGRNDNGAWFYGGGIWRRASLATCAVAMGLMAGVLVPDLSDTTGFDDTDGDLWVSEASWLDDSATDGLAGMWLDIGFAEESDGS